MTAIELEHVNITVSDAARTAATLCDLFGWHIRWQGPVMNGTGHTIHVGSERSYLALYQPGAAAAVAGHDSYASAGALNHIAVTVSDIDAMEARVLAAGYTPHLHADYEPGRRFYFDGDDGVEYEIVSYA